MSLKLNENLQYEQNVKINCSSIFIIQNVKQEIQYFI